MTLNVRVGASLVFATTSLILTATPVFAQCKLPELPYVSMSAVIGSGGWLSSDGRGAYIDGSQGSTVNLVNAANLVTNNGAPLNKNSRHVTFNLNSPVAGDPLAQPLGIVQDRQGEVHVFYN